MQQLTSRPRKEKTCLTMMIKVQGNALALPILKVTANRFTSNARGLTPTICLASSQRKEPSTMPYYLHRFHLRGKHIFLIFAALTFFALLACAVCLATSSQTTPHHAHANTPSIIYPTGMAYPTGGTSADIAYPGQTRPLAIAYPTGARSLDFIPSIGYPFGARTLDSVVPAIIYPYGP